MFLIINNTTEGLKPMPRKARGLKAQMRDWNYHSRELKRAITPPKTVHHLGREFMVTHCERNTLYGETKTNEWLLANPENGVLMVTDTWIICAALSDNGARL